MKKLFSYLFGVIILLGLLSLSTFTTAEASELENQDDLIEIDTSIVPESRQITKIPL